jgi:diguanylate cyclase
MQAAKLQAEIVTCELKDTVAQLSREMQKRQRFEQQLRKQALHDSLTGLPNRTLLMDRLEHAISLAQRNQHSLTLLFIDLDHLKMINDNLGHAFGDELLKVMSQRVSRCIRKSDTFARLGGDEFVLLLPTAIPEEALTSLTDCISRAIAQPVELGGREICVTCSIGCSFYQKDGTDPAMLLKHADVAMYKAKEQGGNGIRCYTPALFRRANERLDTELQLKQALQRDEFRVRYQPQIDLRTGEIVSVEALIRWQHSEWGPVPLAQFIPIAEETGLIKPIGEWVLRTACVQVAAWTRDGLPALRVSVNLSAQQLLAPDLDALVTKILAESGLPPQQLELELTESVSMKDPQETIRILTAIRALGINIAIDNFGTGYSNLSYLHRFPLNRIKLDRALVCELTRENHNHVVVEAIIAMAHRLRLGIVAEGVETIEQRNQLQIYGCDLMQGNWFSPPLDSESCAALLRDHRVSTAC